MRPQKGSSSVRHLLPRGVTPHDPNTLAAALADAGEPFCMLVVMSARGATPRRAGAKAVLFGEGQLVGSIGGGEVEHQALHAAASACDSGLPAWLDVPLGGDMLDTRGPACGGAMSVLIDPTAGADAPAYASASKASLRRKSGLLLTRVRRGRVVGTTVTWLSQSSLAKRSWSDPPVDRAAALECLSDGQARLVEGEDADGTPAAVLIEPVLPLPRLYIAGAGHIGLFLAHYATHVGFESVLIDERPVVESYGDAPPEVRMVTDDPALYLANCNVDEHTYIVIVTHSHQTDLEALRACIRRPARYIGMIGSRRKVAMTREALIASGDATAEEFDRVHAPIGLDIGAETPAEIATSILAELIAVRRRRL